MSFLLILQGMQPTTFVFEGKVFSRNGALSLSGSVARSDVPMLLMADFKAMEWISPAGPPTVCHFDIEGVGVEEVGCCCGGGTCAFADVLFVSAMADVFSAGEDDF